VLVIIWLSLPHSDQRPSTVLSSALYHQPFEFGKGILNRIEIGAARRQEPQFCAHSFDGRAGFVSFVTAQIIEHHNIDSF
jgi:hypothetical protein